MNCSIFFRFISFSTEIFNGHSRVFYTKQRIIHTKICIAKYNNNISVSTHIKSLRYYNRLPIKVVYVCFGVFQIQFPFFAICVFCHVYYSLAFGRLFVGNRCLRHFVYIAKRREHRIRKQIFCCYKNSNRSTNIYRKYSQKKQLQGKKPFKIVLQKYLTRFTVLLRRMKTIFPYLYGILYFQRICVSFESIQSSILWRAIFSVMRPNWNCRNLFHMKSVLNNFPVLFVCNMFHLCEKSCENRSPNL